MKHSDPERPCGYCRHERFMHEHYKPKGLIKMLFMPRWFAGVCLTPECDCKIYRLNRKELKNGSIEHS